MADRSILVALRANTTDFQQEMGKAATSLDALVKKSGDASGAADTTLGRLAQSAEHQRAAWNTVGTTVGGIGAAWTGVNVLIGKTGISYNTLQQTSRAALSTILGGAREANAQMDKLDEFARTSPFAKDVFITAQQQMLGFGIEAGKVIPYLSAINEAVAATGGSNHDLAELTRIFAQIHAAQKINATDLMQFGQRGVDAATLIGDAMGKTGAQIRDEITAGTLDADAALDALAQGMQTRFAGASAGIKNTMGGAIDRVKAAWRDLTADMTAGLVSPDGGGMLVGATNTLADLLRLVGKLPDPLKQSAYGLSSVAGAAATVYGASVLAVPRLIEFHKAVKTLSESNPKLAKGLGKLSGALGKVAISAAVLTTVGPLLGEVFGTPRVKEVEAFDRAIDRFVNSGNIETLNNLLRSSRKDILGSDDLVQGVQNYEDVFDALAFSNNSGGIFFDKLIGRPLTGLMGMSTEIEKLEQVIGGLDQQMASLDGESAGMLFTELHAVASQTTLKFEDFIDLMPQYAQRARDVAAANGVMNLSQEQLITLMSGGTVAVQDAIGGPWRSFSLVIKDVAKETASTKDGFESLFNTYEVGTGVMSNAEAGQLAYLAVLEDSEDPAKAFDAALEAMGAKAVLLDGKMHILTEAQASFAEAVIEASAGMVDAGAAYDTVIANNEKLKGNFAATGEAMLEEMRKQAEAYEEFIANQIELMGTIDNAFLQHLVERGPEVVAAAAALTPEQRAEMQELWYRSGQDNAEAHARGLLAGEPVVRAAGIALGAEAMEGVKADLQDGMPVQDVIDKWDLDLVVALLTDTEPAMLTTDEFMAKVEADRATVEIDADTAPAAGEAAEFVKDTEAQKPTVTVDGDAKPAYAEVASWKSDTDNTTGRVKVDADTDPAIRAAEAAMARIRAMSTRIGVTADIKQNITRRVFGQAEQADGGIMEFFANGGLRDEDHIAQIAPRGTTRVFNEPETLGEAYIPLAESKRTRSLEIWAETGKRLGVDGFEDGAVVTHARAAQPIPFAPRPSSAAFAGSPTTVGLSDADITRLASALREGAYSGTQTGIAERQAGVRIDSYRGRSK